MSISRIQDTRGIGNINAPRRPRNSMVAEPKQPEDAKKYRFAKGGKSGLYANIDAKKKRIANGSGEKMKKPGAKGAPTAADFRKSAKTAKKK